MGDKQRFRFIGTYPEGLADGRPIGVGEYVRLSEEELDDPHNQALVEDGKLIPAEAEPEATEAAIDLADKEGVTLTAVSGTGASGQITVDDVKRHIAQQAEAAAQQDKEGAS